MACYTFFYVQYEYCKLEYLLRPIVMWYIILQADNAEVMVFLFTTYHFS